MSDVTSKVQNKMEAPSEKRNVKFSLKGLSFYTIMCQEKKGQNVLAKFIKYLNMPVKCVNLS